MTKELTVRQLAALAGVTVRTLHHYDEIGLLPPARVGHNGYRYYGRAEMLRHRERLEAHRGRLSVLIETIDTTVAGLKGESPMSNADLYRGFSAEKQAEYEAWLVEHYGPGMRESIEASHARWSGADEAAREAAMVELQQIEAALAEACRRDIDVESDAIDGLVRRHRAWVAMMWGRPCEPSAYAGLADMYEAHPDFVARYERLAPGFTAFLVRAMKAHAGRERSGVDT